MAFFRKAGSILGRSVSNCISSQDVTMTKASIFQAVRWMSSSKVFVGGISYSTDDMSLREAFSKHGEVAEARVILDRETGRSRGFGFVTFSSSEEASAAIQALDQQELHGRVIRVAYANDRTRGFGGGGGYNRGYGNDGGNYGGGGGGYGGNYSGGGGGYGGNYGGGGGGYGGDYNSGGGGGGGYNDSGSYGGGSNYNSGVGDYGSAGGTSAGYDHQSFGAAGGNGSFGRSSVVENDNFGRSSAGGAYDGFGDESSNSNEGVGGGEGFGEDDGNKFKEGDDTDNYADRRS